MVARGPHLPLGADTIVLERLADELSATFGIARTPAIPFGVHSRHDPDAPGSAALTRKTLHRLMNELIAGWETEAKVETVVILTTHAAEAHLEALSTIRSIGQVTLIDIYAAAVPDETSGSALDTALLMWIAPSLVDRAMMPRTGARDPESGERLYHRILDRTAQQIRALLPASGK
jgi:creatinine amidohydrolase